MNNSINTDRPDFETAKEYLKVHRFNLDHVNVQLAERIMDSFAEQKCKPLLSTVKRLQEENERLKAWKESEMSVWRPLLDYFHNEDKLITLGKSISEEALRRSKEYVRLQEENEQLKEALIAAKVMMERDKVGGYTRAWEGYDVVEKGSTYEKTTKALKSSELNKEEQ